MYYHHAVYRNQYRCHQENQIACLDPAIVASQTDWNVGWSTIVCMLNHKLFKSILD